MGGLRTTAGEDSQHSHQQHHEMGPPRTLQVPGLTLMKEDLCVHGSPLSS
ncbi:beta-galactosidase [Cystobacter fuscus DSM 2262]|uniref:Beta-galactosidase n=1 Tax=Cystobacter fuscus (strain ATCC 25194 / DSM 2262 / NBRC 100088 / M29) TaxID=1242864 RepID=S9P6K7_CYSF2|nr:beta-galactosidase [Cystobacter fuscus DSM 2262]